MSDTLEQVLADERGMAQVLRAAGHAREADNIDRLLDRVRASALDYLDWLTEGEARLRSGKSVEWLRSRFPQWAASGHARRDGTRRLYRQLVVPKRANASAAREAGRRGDRESA